MHFRMEFDSGVGPTCYYHIKVRTLQVKVYLIVPNYNYSTPLISMNILDHIILYNPNIINPYIKLLPFTTIYRSENTIT